LSKLSVIIPVRNEEDTIENVINELKQLDPFEILIVLNGSTDNTKKIVEGCGCKVIEYSESLGHDIGRALGSFFASGDILLFVDGDIVIPHQELIPFIKAIENGHDIALNNLEIIFESKMRPHSISVLKKTINDLFHHSNLSLNSLVAIPHAISKKAVDKIGWKNLSVPPLAQAIAMKKGLSICSPAYVDVISSNKIRPEFHLEIGSGTPYPLIENVIFGDHLAAINYLIHNTNHRGGFRDNRKREFIHNVTKTPIFKKCKKSAVICDDSFGNESSLLIIIENLKDAGAEEILVISFDESENKKSLITKKDGTFIHLFPEFGSFMSRLVGALLSAGEITLFTDGVTEYSPQEFVMFFEAIENGVDVALRNTSHLLDNHPANQLYSLEYFLNLILKKAELANNSLVHLPHAFHRKVIERINSESLIIPPLAQVKIIENQFLVKPISINKDIRKMLPAHNLNILIGDHVEAFSYYLSITNERGNFTAGNKNFEELNQIRNIHN
jgi:glycosyltransferase involved in cell wall biosynthesis